MKTIDLSVTCSSCGNQLEVVSLPTLQEFEIRVGVVPCACVGEKAYMQGSDTGYEEGIDACDNDGYNDGYNDGIIAGRKEEK